MSELKVRVKSRHIMSGTSVNQAWLVEVLMERKWIPLGAEGTLTEYKTREDAEKAAQEIRDSKPTIA